LKDNINQYNRKNPYTSSSITVLIPKGEARIISESRNAEYNFTDFLENAIPIRKLSLELLNHSSFRFSTLFLLFVGISRLWTKISFKTTSVTYCGAFRH
uniref:SERPIN domain-containing protein n=1 Tax=Schistosoma curassoni TaxID=6186 RepID=A0A183K2R2_9TREM